ncbi:MAG: hypothetical protein H8D34_16865 [Chloroflexi bacterium]|nr:hypothetical protein [Chloroflexota bacterium]
MKHPKPKKKSYWYLYVHRESVLCGCGGTSKRRIYDRSKPENPQERHIVEQFCCGIHFV